MSRLLEAIVAAGGAAHVDFAKHDLSYLAMGSDAVREALAQHRGRGNPVWYSEATEGLDLRNANLAGLDLSHSLLWRADLRGANLHNADLDSADLGKSVLGASDLRSIRLAGANVSGCVFDDADLTDADLREAAARDVDFTRARAVTRIRLANAVLDGAVLDLALMSTIGFANAEEARSAYATLRRSFLRSGRYDDASRAYLAERNEERAQKSPYRAASLQNAVRAMPRWAIDWIEFLTSGYGEKPLRTIAAALLLVSVFATAFALTGSIGLAGGGNPDAVDYLQYSLASFSTITLTGVIPTTQFGRLLTSAEALTGIGILALLMFSLGRRIART